MHIALAADDVAHVREYAVSGAGHCADHELHGRPALCGDRGDVVFSEKLLIEQHECVHLVKHRLAEIVYLIHAAQQLHALCKLILLLGEDAVVLVLHDGEVDGDNMDVEILHKVALVENDGAEGLGTHADLSHAQVGEVLDCAGDSHKAVEAVGELLVLNEAVFNVCKGNVHALEHAAHTEQTALGVGITGAVRQEGIILRTPEKHGLAYGLGDGACDLFVAEIAVYEEHGVHILFPEALNDSVDISVAVEHVHVVYTVKVDEGDMLIGEVCLDIADGLCASLFCFLPVEYAGARSNIPADGNQTYFDIIAEHNAPP